MPWHVLLLIGLRFLRSASTVKCNVVAIRQTEIIIGLVQYYTYCITMFPQTNFRKLMQQPRPLPTKYLPIRHTSIIVTFQAISFFFLSLPHPPMAQQPLVGQCLIIKDSG